MKNGRFKVKDSGRLLQTLLIAVLTILTLMATAIGVILPQAQAVGSYNNAAIADIALSKLGQYGGQCKAFMNSVVSQASSGTQWPAPGYHRGFQNAGGIEVSSVNATKGDIIQVGDSDYDWPLHTAIVVENYGNGNFWVVDSNRSFNEIVGQGAYSPYNVAAGTTSVVKIWRMGTVNGGGNGPLPDPDTPGSPIGDISFLREPGGVRIYGWARDQDVTSPIAVHVYGGTGEATSTNPLVGTYADQYREDVGNRAFSVFFSVGAGTQTYCAYGLNLGQGQNRRFDCVRVQVQSDPMGNLEYVQRVPGGVQASGWALDPDTSLVVTVHVYGGNGAATRENPLVGTYADQSRPDVESAFPGYGNAHGFSTFLATGVGPQTFCVYALNVSGTPGVSRQLLCRTA